MEKFIKEIESIIKKDLEDGEKLDKLIFSLDKFKPVISKSLYNDIKDIIDLDADKYSDGDVIIVINNYLESLKI